MRFAFIAISLVFVACSGTSGGISLRCADCLEVQVDRVLDGHTLETSLGRVRLFGVNAPERGEPCYGQATELLRQLLGDSVRLEPGPRSVDSSGRLLYYAYTQDGVSVDATLIIGGLGVAERKDGQHRDYLVGLETESRAESTGCIWQSTDLDYGQIANPNFNALMPGYRQPLDDSRLDRSKPAEHNDGSPLRPALQAGGQGFDPPHLHHLLVPHLSFPRPFIAGRLPGVVSGL